MLQYSCLTIVSSRPPRWLRRLLLNIFILSSLKLPSFDLQKFRPKLVVNLKNCVVLDCADNGEDEGGQKRLTDSWDMSAPGDIGLTDSRERPSSTRMQREKRDRVVNLHAELYEFRIHSLTESVIFRANSQESKDLWMSHIITEVNLLTGIGSHLSTFLLLSSRRLPISFLLSLIENYSESKLTSHPLWRSKASYGISSLRKRTLQVRVQFFICLAILILSSEKSISLAI
jgi:hypothetical protein